MPYEFTHEEFNRFSKEVIDAGGDQATLTTLLADMQTTITDAIMKAENDTKTVTTITEENERLRNANMSLFLRVGAEQTREEPKPEEQHEPLRTADYMKSYFDKLDESSK